MKKFNFKKSFTLVELMIVIVILAILSAIVIFTLNPSELFKKNRDSRRVADIQTLYKGITFMESWYTGGMAYGSTSTIYISLPDSSSTCSSYTLPTLPTGYSYNCQPLNTYRNTDGNGWVPIDFTISNNNRYISTLPVDPLNNETYYYSYNPGGSFEVNSLLESIEYINKFSSNDGGDSFNSYENGTSLISLPLTFPNNWIKVPGNSLYNTSDFWVMQYEAKYAIDGRTGSDTPLDCRNNANYDTYDWNKDCSYKANNAQNVVSSPLGSPIAGITHTEAKAICQSLGAHLITNQEWMTIARNIDQQPSNWTSGVVGTGYLFNGNSGDTSRGYKAFTDRYDSDKGLNRNQRASHVLSNSNRIYDFSGNVWEHVMFDINDTLLNNQPKVTGTNNNWVWSELTALTSYGDNLSSDLLKPTNSAWNANQGIGRIYHRDGTDDSSYTNRGMLRGGYFSSTSLSGVCATGLNFDTGDDRYSIGFRCAR